MAEKAVKKSSRRRFKGIEWLIAELQTAKKDFTKDTLAQNYELDKKFENFIRFFHADRSYDDNNYSPLDIIEVELISRHHELRLHILKRIIALAERKSYRAVILLDLVWKDFLYADSLDFGSWGPRDTGWSSKGLAKKAKDAIFPALLEILELRLDENPASEKRDEYLLMLSGIRARYNQSTSYFKQVDLMLKILDPENKYKHRYK